MSSLFISLPMIAMGATLLFIALHFWKSGRDFTAQGVEARANITRKFRKPGPNILYNAENCFVTAEFVDRNGDVRTIEIQVPSRQWHFLRAGSMETILYIPSNPNRARVTSQTQNGIVNVILIFAMLVGVLFVVAGTTFTFVPLKPVSDSSIASAPAITREPAPTQFDSSGVEHNTMLIDPHHARVAVLDEKGARLTIHDLGSGARLVDTRADGWRLLSWSPDASRIAVAEGEQRILLDAATLARADGDYWNPPEPALAAACRDSEPVWDAQHKQAAAACGNNVMVLSGGSVRLLAGHRGRVLGIAWNAAGDRLGTVGEDNYARVWDVEHLQTIAISEDLPYPRAIYAQDDRTWMVIDAALRSHIFRTAR